MIRSLGRQACCATFVLGLAACAPAPAEAPAEAKAAAQSAATASDWTLDPAASHLSYVSLKAGEIAETNRFERLSGTIAADGTARIEIALASVNTGISQRDERMREIFFEVAEFPTAVVTAALDPARFTSLGVGQVTVRPLAATLALKGVEAPIETEVQVARVSEDRVLVAPTRPVIITTDMFGLTDELGELRALAQLPSISPAVPVTFTLAFRR